MTSDTTSAPSTAFRAVGGLRLLTWPALDASGAGAAVTARSGGVSSGPYTSLNLSLSVGDDPGRVLENRRRLAAAFGAAPGDFVFARQVHGPGARVVACVHAGWRGTVAGVTAAALTAMQDLGTRSANITAGIGPAIGADRYQVGPDVHQAVTRTFGPAAAGFIRPDPSAAGRWLLDLWAANRHALRQAGVPGPRIHTTGIPTGPVPGYFFS